MENKPKKKPNMVKKTKRIQKKTKQKLPEPGHHGREVQRRTTLDKHSEFVVPILFPLREGGIWAPCEGASILEKAQIP